MQTKWKQDETWSFFNDATRVALWLRHTANPKGTSSIPARADIFFKEVKSVIVPVLIFWHTLKVPRWFKLIHSTPPRAQSVNTARKTPTVWFLYSPRTVVTKTNVLPCLFMFRLYPGHLTYTVIIGISVLMSRNVAYSL